MKRGFTLAELLGVGCLLFIIAAAVITGIVLLVIRLWPK